MNKAELIEAVQQKLGGDTSKRAAADALQAVLDSIAATVKKDESVQIVGFGTFKPVERKSRIGRNPKTKEPITIPPSRSVRFVPSSALKSAR